MSDLEKATVLLRKIPEQKIGFVIAYMQGLIAEDSEDKYCLELLKEYENDTDPEKDEEYSLEECEREWEIV